MCDGAAKQVQLVGNITDRRFRLENWFKKVSVIRDEL